MDMMGLIGPNSVATAAVAPFDIDGTPVTNNTGAGTTINLVGFTTTFPNDVVYIAYANNGGLPTPPTGGGLTFTQRATRFAGATTISLYSAVAASPLSAVTFVCAQASVDFMTALAFAFSGSHSASPFDSNGAIPNSGTAAGTPFTTNNANDILVVAGVSNAAVDLPFISMSSTAIGNFLSCGYSIVSSTQSGVTTAFGGNTTINVAIDAIIKGP